MSSPTKNREVERPPSHGLSKERIPKDKEKTLKKEKSDNSLTSVAPINRDRPKNKVTCFLLVNVWRNLWQTNLY